MTRTKEAARRGGMRNGKPKESKKPPVAKGEARPPVNPGKHALKRKRDESDDVETVPTPKRAAAVSSPAPNENQVDEKIAMMDPALLADHFAKLTRKVFPDSSPIELEEMYIPTSAFLSTSDYENTHVASNLPEFLEKIAPGGKAELSSSDSDASPHTLVITSSGIRTADIRRELVAFETDASKVAKFIASHMKLKKNVQFLQGKKVGIAISTPGRIEDLINNEALKTESLRRIVVDGSYKDAKNRTIFDMEELFRPLMGLLNHAEIRKKLGSKEDEVNLVVF